LARLGFALLCSIDSSCLCSPIFPHPETILPSDTHICTPPQTYTAGVWSKGEHPKFTDLRQRWNGAVKAAGDKMVELFDVTKK
jgi:hypothetical protein